MTARDSILVVDDDPQVLALVERFLKSRFDVTAVSSSEAALQLLDNEVAFAVVLSDLRLPGRDGVHLLQTVRKRFPDVVRILMSGEAHLRDAVAAVNEGHVFRLLTKPFDMPTLTTTIAAACEQHHLLDSERVLLEQTLQGSIKALTDMLAIVQPAAFGRAERLRRHAADLAERIGVSRRWDVEVAAMLSQIGCITLEATTLDRWYHNRALDPGEQAQVARLPQVAADLIAGIPRLEDVRAILRRQYDAPDASQLPIGAAILAIARDFDLLIAQGASADRALATMEGRAGRYNTELLRQFRSIRGASAPAAVIRGMFLIDVSEGMIFAADVHSPAGPLLIARGQRVSAAIMERIRMQWCDLAITHDVRMIVSVPVVSASI